MIKSKVLYFLYGKMDQLHVHCININSISVNSKNMKLYNCNCQRNNSL